MPWTAPKSWSTSEMVTATHMNTHVRDNLLMLRAGYATTLPGSPDDSQVAILVDSTSAPTYRWHLRYNASIADAYKWEFIGGTPLVSATSNVSHANTSTYRFTSTLLTVGVAGIYDTIIHSRAVNGGVGNMYTVGVNAAADDTYASPQATGSPGPGMYHVQRRTLAASDALSIAYRVTVASVNYTLYDAGLRILPVRIG